MELAVKTENLWYTYPNGTEALRGIDLEINRASCVAILGENGSGKTTLTKHFNGLLKPTKGKVFVDGQDTEQVTAAELSREVGYVFQNPDHQLFAETVEQELAFAPRNLGLSEAEVRERVNWVLKKLDLERYRGKSPLTLSLGERRRVSLASVLVLRPEILILDEPTTGQDQQQKDRLARVLSEFRRDGTTIIVVTHDIEFVAEHIERTILLHAGRILSEGETRKILTNIQLLDEISFRPPQITQLIQLMSRAPSEIMVVPEAYVAIQEWLKDAVR